LRLKDRIPILSFVLQAVRQSLLASFSVIGIMAGLFRE
jgi:hypothetical protein